MPALTENDIELLEPMFSRCLKDAALSLSQMLGQEVISGDAIVKEITFDAIPYIFGGSQKIISGIYLAYKGFEPIPEDPPVSADGHLLLTFNIESAFEIAGILSKDLDVPLDRIGGMTDSIFGEIGNVFGASFLSSLGNMVAHRLFPSVPTVINYKATTIMEYVYNKIKSREIPIFLIQTYLHSDKHTIEGKFFLIPENYRSILHFINKRIK